MHSRNVDGLYASGDIMQVNIEGFAEGFHNFGIVNGINEGQALQKLFPKGSVVQRIPSHGRQPYDVQVRLVPVGVHAVPRLPRIRFEHGGAYAQRPALSG
jgi:hypothetical protein